ncbi:MAG: dihydroorotase [Verrucomicrobiaceae bacterium]|nr:dihydroorotase [Verrucomicrobiaceae bacterium]
MKRLYRNGRIATDSSSEPLKCDVLIEDVRIIGVAETIESVDGCEVIDCSGSVIVPALFDLNVHIRELGREDREDITSCSEAAINGGFTGMVLQSDTNPAIDTGSAVQGVLDTCRDKSRIWQGVYTAGAITKGGSGEELAAIAAMKSKGAVFLSEAGDPVINPQLLRRAMEYARQFDLPVATHGEVKELSGKGSMHEGAYSYSLGLQGIPAISEEIGIARDVRLAEFCGVHLHVQQVSTREGMSTVLRAKERGIRVTCEVSPHHLIFNHSHIGNYDTHYKVNPPLRTEEDSVALLEGLRNGWIDVVACDHSPRTEFEKNQDFASAPFGVTGLETALPSLHHHFIKPGHFGWDVIVNRYSTGPRKFLSIPPVTIKEGHLAEFVVFNPNATVRFAREYLRSKSINTPFLNQTLSGQVERVIFRGAELLVR